MKKLLDQIKEFYVMCRAEDQLQSSPTVNITEKVKQIRKNLISEEVKELFKAMDEGDLIEILDAICDLNYVINGTTLAYGLQDIAEEAQDEVHRSNMSKAGEDGKVIMREDGKILKPSTWSPPDLKKILLPWL